MRKGIAYAISGYVLWGLLPIYWKQLQHVPASQIIAHRIVWSCVLLCGAILYAQRWQGFWQELRKPRLLARFTLAAALIGVNWLVYIWGVNAGFIVETSLGYFINPLISVLLGVVFLHERLRPGQWVAVGVAASGVLYLTFAYGALPWIALVLAVSFGFYDLIKKTAPLGARDGLALETGLLLPLALLYLLYSDSIGQGAFLRTNILTDVLLIGAGLVTSAPLLLFAGAAQRIPLSVLGLFQYIAPTLQFLLGVLLYNEPFDLTRLVGFALVWAALVLFVVEGWYIRRAATRMI